MTARVASGTKALPTTEHVARILARFPDVRQVRLDPQRHTVNIGFYEMPAAEVLAEIESTVQNELAGEWNIALHAVDASAEFHEHEMGDGAVEFHRSHPPNEPRVIWKRVFLPAWRNRPVPPHVIRDYRIMLVLAGICGVCTLTGFILSRSGFHLASFAPFFVVAYLAGAWFAAQDCWAGLKHGKVDIQFLMIAVAIGALFVDAWTEGATLLFLFSLSNALEQFANYRTRKTIDSLLKVAPKLALRRENSAWVEVPVEEIAANDELLVKAGELFPVDGLIIEGATSADESALTGESLPVPKRPGDAVGGGTLNLDGQAIIRVTREVQESALSRILSLIESAQQQKAPAQRFTDAFSRYYTWFALSLAAVVFAVLIFLQHAPSTAFYRAMTVLVVASPCALVLSIPSAILVAIAAAARRGILFRGGVAVENLASVTQFAFDKTGTLTKGALVVSEIVVFNAQSEESLLQIAGAIAELSTHPLARAIARETEQRRLSTQNATDFKNLPGLGMEAFVDGRKILMGSRALLRERGIALPSVPATSDAEVWVADDQALGLIYLRDEVRPNARHVIDFLKRRGVAVALMTGDRLAPAEKIAAQVGIEDVRAEFTPEAKLRCVHEWRAAGKKVAMVGDGINDAPSLTAADVSIGMGARGSDAALEQADVILMHDKIENVEEAFELSRRARSIIRQNITISLGVICLLLISALAEKINLTTGVIGHEGSTVVVILNGLRLLRFRQR